MSKNIEVRKGWCGPVISDAACWCNLKRSCCQSRGRSGEPVKSRRALRERPLILTPVSSRAIELSAKESRKGVKEMQQITGTAMDEIAASWEPADHSEPRHSHFRAEHTGPMAGP